MYHPNLLLMVNKSKKMEVNDIKKPKPAAKTIETAIIRRPDAIPPSLNAILVVIFKFIIEHICY